MSATTHSIIATLVQYIASTGLDEKGLFRSPADPDSVANLESRLRSQTNPNLGDWTDVRAAGVALKNALKTLPEPLLTYDLYEELRDIDQLGDTQAKVATLKDLIWSRLPQLNRDTLLKLLYMLYRFCSNSAKNKMTPTVVAMLFAPYLMRPRKGVEQNPNKVTSVIVTMIDSCVDLLQVPPSRPASPPSRGSNYPQRNTPTPPSNYGTDSAAEAGGVSTYGGSGNGGGGGGGMRPSSRSSYTNLPYRPPSGSQAGTPTLSRFPSQGGLASSGSVFGVGGASGGGGGGGIAADGFSRPGDVSSPHPTSQHGHLRSQGSQSQLSLQGQFQQPHAVQQQQQQQQQPQQPLVIQPVQQLHAQQSVGQFQHQPQPAHLAPATLAPLALEQQASLARVNTLAAAAAAAAAASPSSATHEPPVRELPSLSLSPSSSLSSSTASAASSLSSSTSTSSDSSNAFNTTVGLGTSPNGLDISELYAIPGDFHTAADAAAAGAELEQAKAALTELLTELRESNRDLSQARASEAALQEELAAALSALAVASESKANIEAEAAHLRAALFEAQSSHQALSVDGEGKQYAMVLRIQRLESEKEQLRAQLNQVLKQGNLPSAVFDSQNQLRRAYDELHADRESDKAKFEKKLEEVKAQATAECSRMQDAVEEAHRKLDDARRELEDTKGHYASLDEDHAECGQRYSRLQSDYDTLASQKLQCDTKVRDLEEQLLKLKLEAADKQTAASRQHEADSEAVQGLKNELAELKGLLSGTSASGEASAAAAAQAQVQSLSSALAEAEGRAAKATAQAASASESAAHAAQRVASLERERDELTTALIASQQAQLALVAKLEEAAAEATAAAAADSEREMDSTLAGRLRAANAALAAQVRRAEDGKAEALAAAAAAEATAGRESDARAAAEKTVEDKNATIAKLQDELLALGTELSAAQSASIEAAKDQAVAAARSSATNTLANAAAFDYASLHQLCATLRVENEQAVSAVASLTAQLDTCTATHEAEVASLARDRDRAVEGEHAALDALAGAEQRCAQLAAERDAALDSAASALQYAEGLAAESDARATEHGWKSVGVQAEPEAYSFTTQTLLSGQDLERLEDRATAAERESSELKAALAELAEVADGAQAARVEAERGASELRHQLAEAEARAASEAAARERLLTDLGAEVKMAQDAAVEAEASKAAANAAAQQAQDYAEQLASDLDESAMARAESEARTAAALAECDRTEGRLAQSAAELARVSEERDRAVARVQSLTEQVAVVKTAAGEHHGAAAAALKNLSAKLADAQATATAAEQQSAATRAAKDEVAAALAAVHERVAELESEKAGIAAAALAATVAAEKFKTELDDARNCVDELEASVGALRSQLQDRAAQVETATAESAAARKQTADFVARYESAVELVNNLAERNAGLEASLTAAQARAERAAADAATAAATVAELRGAVQAETSRAETAAAAADAAGRAASTAETNSTAHQAALAQAWSQIERLQQALLDAVAAASTGSRTEVDVADSLDGEHAVDGRRGAHVGSDPAGSSPVIGGDAGADGGGTAEPSTLQTGATAHIAELKGELAAATARVRAAEQENERHRCAWAWTAAALGTALGPLDDDASGGLSSSAVLSFMMPSAPLHADGGELGETGAGVAARGGDGTGVGTVADGHVRRTAVNLVARATSWISTALIREAALEATAALGHSVVPEPVAHSEFVGELALGDAGLGASRQAVSDAPLATSTPAHSKHDNTRHHRRVSSGGGRVGPGSPLPSESSIEVAREPSSPSTSTVRSGDHLGSSAAHTAGAHYNTAPDTATRAASTEAAVVRLALAAALQVAEERVNRLQEECSVSQSHAEYLAASYEDELSNAKALLAGLADRLRAVVEENARLHSALVVAQSRQREAEAGCSTAGSGGDAATGGSGTGGASEGGGDLADSKPGSLDSCGNCAELEVKLADANAAVAAANEKVASRVVTERDTHDPDKSSSRQSPGSASEEVLRSEHAALTSVLEQTQGELSVRERELSRLTQTHGQLQASHAAVVAELADCNAKLAQLVASAPTSGSAEGSRGGGNANVSGDDCGESASSIRCDPSSPTNGCNNDAANSETPNELVPRELLKELEELRAAASERETEVSSLREQVAQLVNTSTVAEDEAESLREQVAQLVNTSTVAEDEAESLREQLVAVTAERDSALANIEAEAAAEATESAAVESARLTELRRELESLLEDRDRTAAACTQALEELQEAIEDRAVAEAAATAARSERQTLVEERDTAVHERQAAVEARNAAEARAEEAEAGLRRATAEVDIVKSDAAVAAKAAESALEHVRAQLSSAHSRLAAAGLGVEDSGEDGHGSAAATVEFTTLSDALAALAEVRSERDSLSAELQVMYSEQAAASLAAEQTEEEVVSSKLAAARSAESAAQSLLASAEAKNAEVTAAREAADTARTEAEQARGEVDALRAALERDTADLEENRTRVETALRNALADEQAAAHLKSAAAADAAAAEALKATANAEYAHAQSARRSAQQLVDAVQNERVELQAHVAEERKELSEDSRKLRRAEAALAKREVEIQGKYHAVELREAALAAKESELATAAANLEASAYELLAGCSPLPQVSATLSELQTTSRAAVEEAAVECARLATLSAELAEQRSVVSSGLKEIEASRAALQREAATLIADAEHQAELLTAEVKRRRAAVVEQEQDITKREFELTRAKAAYESSLAEWRATVATTSEALDGRAAEIHSAEVAVASERAAIAAERAALDVRRAALDDEVRRVTEREVAAAAQVSQAAATAASAEATAQHHKEQAEVELARATEMRSAAATALQQTEQERASVQATGNRLLREANAAKEDHQRRVKVHVLALQEKSALVEEKAQLLEQVVQMRKRIAEMEMSVSNQENLRELNQTKAAGLLQTLQVVQPVREQLVRLSGLLQTEVEAYNNAEAELKGELAAVHETLKAEREKWREEKKDLLQSRARIQKERAAAVAAAESEVELLLQAIAERDEAVERMKANVTELTELAEAATDRAKRAEAEAAMESAHSESLSAALSEIQSRSDRELQEALAKSGAARLAAQTEADEHRRLVALYTRKISALELRCQEAETNVSTLKGEVARLSASATEQWRSDLTAM